MGYAVSYYSLLSWLDAMALLPLVALGLQRLVKENKSLLYILSLAVTVVANYYTGFMVCAASVLMYIALILTHKDGIANSLKKRWFLCGIQSAGRCSERMEYGSHGAVFTRWAEKRAGNAHRFHL